MYCYHCGSMLDGSDLCPVCNTNVRLYKKIVATANQHYNTGLRRARERDLHGAAESLSRSLRLYKMNTDARNLLGLVYYEMGDYSSAITEWSISRALQPEYNDAEEYLEELIGGVRRDDLNQDIRKYNQAIIYNEQGNDDLALIQLKKVVSDLPNFIDARKLLALIYTKQDNFEEARQEIRTASKIDRKDRELQRYMKMITRARRESGARRRRNSSNSVTRQSGTQTIIEPKYSPVMTARSAALNIAIGLILGIVVFYFLVVPSLRTAIYQEANQTVVTVQERASAEASTVDALEAQISSLEDEVAAYASADAENEKQLAAYQHLVSAYSALLEEDTGTAKEELLQIDQSDLTSDELTVYSALYLEACSDEMASMYLEIYSAHKSGDYETVIELAQELVTIQESYRNGEVLLYLGIAYYMTDQVDEAQEVLEEVAASYSNYSRMAQTYLDYMEDAAAAEETDEIEEEELIEDTAEE